MSEHTRTRPWGPIPTFQALARTLTAPRPGLPRPVAPAHVHLQATDEGVGLIPALPAAVLTIGSHKIRDLANWARVLDVHRVTLNGQAGALNGFITITGWLQHNGPIVLVSDIIWDLAADVSPLGVQEISVRRLFELAAGAVPAMAATR